VYSDGLATKKKTSNQTLTPGLHRPFWFDLPERFYLTLQRAAEEFQTTRAELVGEAIRLKPSAPSKPKKRPAAPGGLTKAAKEKLVKEFLGRARILGWEKQRAQDMVSPEQSTKEREDFTRIFWLDLPASFFQDVKNKAKRYGMSEKQFVTTTVERFIKDERRQRRLVQPISDVQEELVKDFNRLAGEARWRGASEKSRKDHARKMALKRWKKQ
jgi:hypothetical protein